MFKIEFETGNAAFDEEGYEIARILREVADKIEAGRYVESVVDLNGNRIGRVDWINRKAA